MESGNDMTRPDEAGVRQRRELLGEALARLGESLDHGTSSPESDESKVAEDVDDLLALASDVSMLDERVVG